MNSTLDNQRTQIPFAADSSPRDPLAVTGQEAYVFPMSAAQRRLWFVDQLQPGTSAYNLPIALRIDGPLDDTCLENALRQIVSRHEVLRTTFDQIENDAVQIVSPTFDFNLKPVDLSIFPDNERENKLDQLIEEEVKRAFDLRNGPLFRGTLYNVNQNEHILVLNMHHIVADGWSFRVILRELGIFYESFSAGKEADLAELPIQYADYAQWQHEFCSTPDFVAKLDFWKDALRGAPQVLDLPIAKPRPFKPSFEASIASLLLSETLTRAVKEISRRHGSTLFMSLMAAFKILLNRYTNEQDIVVGGPVANRNLPEIQDLVGCFVNTMTYRTQLSGDLCFEDVLSKVREATNESFAYQDVPFEKVVEELRPERTLDRNPLFQILFIFQKAFIQPFESPGVSFSPFRIHRKGSPTDMTFFIVEREEGLRVSCEYRNDLFDEPAINRMLGHFRTLLESIVRDPHLPISELSIMPDEEKRQILMGWNNTASDYPKDECIHQLFEAQVERKPDAVALIFDEFSVTYRELNRRANQLAHYLRTLGVGPEDLVGICLERSGEMIVGILGILKAGGAYVPLDPAYPEERISFMLEDSEAAVLLTTEKLVGGLGIYQGKVVLVDLDSEMIAQQPMENPDSSAGPDNLAYVIYTSGSTGKPKGVLITHQNVVRLLQATENWFGFNEHDVWTMFHSYSFDFSVWELWGALAYGGRLVIVPFLVSRSPRDFYRLLREERVTVLNQTPSSFRQLIQAEESQPDPRLSLRYVIFGGEALDFQSLRPWVERHGADSPQLINMYGITETTVHVTFRRLTAKDIAEPAGSLIGRKIPDLQVYVLDRYLQPTPIGVPGEMYVAGPGVARGYLNGSELTNERFTQNPFSRDPESRLYKTGDLARYLSSGELEYLGRIDNQVKIRGFRIELGEIEAVISQFDDVYEAVVIARNEPDGDKRLVAYVVSGSSSKIEPAALRMFLKKKLPNYMVPSAFVQLERLPLTANGKINLNALPPPDRHISAERQESERPKTDTERALAEIWGDLLGLENIGVHDNFFDLGGHSLIAIRMFAAIEEKFCASIPLATLFEAATINELAKILAKSGWAGPESSIVAIQPSGSKPSLFCLHAGGGNVLFYRDLARHLGTEQPVYGVQARRIGGRQVPQNTVEEMAEFYISEIKTLQPNGPYYLCGSSFGGLVGLEIAQKLYQNGEEIGLLAFFDSNSPDYPKLLKDTTPFRRKLYRFTRRVQHHRNSLAGLAGNERIDYIIGKMEKLKLKYRRKAREAYLKMVRFYYLRLKNRKALSAQYIQVENTISKANARYRPQKYPGKITLFRATNQPLGIVPDPTLGWHGIPAELEIHEVPGHHGSLVAEPYVRFLAERLSGCLHLAQMQHSDSGKVRSAEADTGESDLNADGTMTVPKSDIFRAKVVRSQPSPGMAQRSRK